MVKTPSSCGIHDIRSLASDDDPGALARAFIDPYRGVILFSSDRNGVFDLLYCNY